MKTMETKFSVTLKFQTRELVVQVKWVDKVNHNAIAHNMCLCRYPVDLAVHGGTYFEIDTKNYVIV